MRKLFVILLMILPVYIFAQKTVLYDTCIIIKKNNDSILCYSPLAISYQDSIMYKYDKNDNKIFFIRTNEIKYLLTAYNIFENITYENKEKLFQLQVNGEVNLYTYTIQREAPTITYRGGQTTYYTAPLIYYVIKKNDNFYEIKRKKYKEILKEILKDNPDIISKIGRRKYKFDDIKKIVIEYNNYKSKL